jgi:ATP-dependent Clp protease ATP-binding subunit ClpB
MTQACCVNLQQKVKKHFRPEFLNRLDDIIIFSPLTKAHLYQIIKLQIENIAKRLKDKDISIELRPEGAEVILKQAYDPVYGARPLRRYLEKHIVTEISKTILKGELPEHSTIFIEAKNGKPYLRVVTEIKTSHQSKSEPADTTATNTSNPTTNTTTPPPKKPRIQ